MEGVVVVYVGGGVEGRGGGEDGDGERRVVVEYKLAQLHH